MAHAVLGFQLIQDSSGIERRRRNYTQFIAWQQTKIAKTFLYDMATLVIHVVV